MKGLLYPLHGKLPYWLLLEREGQTKVESEIELESCLQLLTFLQSINSRASISLLQLESEPSYNNSI